MMDTREDTDAVLNLIGRLERGSFIALHLAVKAKADCYYRTFAPNRPGLTYDIIVHSMLMCCLWRPYGNPSYLEKTGASITLSPDA